MPRIIGIDIPEKKRLVISLTYIYGIGPTLAEEVIAKLKLDPNMKAKELSQEDIAHLNEMLQNDYIVEGTLRRQVQNNIKRLVNIHSYRGLRHRLGLPVRGQRTRTNARTKKGKKKTMTGRKKAPTAK
ncbi:MAG: 30S ribosomal protein S13 [Waddliaceae bacterium]|jgi:small subunit ribosomal protein S13|nr:30S ribosomal protein S13 [Waddliaceae bacterium]MBT3578641.1 30S ribosomal protein S13 [Waddliaceae bacterium]MBT4445360.1 30S ribosomal protein S13 [Waddliaceae bacterium]MBT6928372.1 30S ribosomal protein S13 [Waddliaceae bacterium]MBT7265058.1 30S ribosomal protein S13 [Waddliaceae bacterium]